MMVAVGFNPRFTASHMRDRVAERRLKPRCPLAHAHIKRRDATHHSYHPWNRGLKPTATLQGRSATLEPQPALNTKRGIAPLNCV
jgi:hypothetical protein